MVPDWGSFIPDGSSIASMPIRHILPAWLKMTDKRNPLRKLWPSSVPG
jgi:hypothetical protein